MKYKTVYICDWCREAEGELVTSLRLKIIRLQTRTRELNHDI